MRIAFDIDDTILIPSVASGFANDTPNYDTIAVLRWFQAQGHTIILWSGSGMDWAKRWGDKFGLQPFVVLPKEENRNIDIAFDDCDVSLAKVNVKVKRLNNNISRKEWNETKKPPTVEDEPAPEKDKLFESAVKCLRDNWCKGETVTARQLAIYMEISYARGPFLIDQLEAAGIISKDKGGKRRVV